MEIKFRDAVVERIKTDLLVIPVREKKLDGPEIRALDRYLRGHLRSRIEKSKFTGAEGSALVYPTGGMLPTPQLVLIGLGDGADSTSDAWRKTGARARKEAATIGAQEIALYFSPEKNPETAAGALVEGALLATNLISTAPTRNQRAMWLHSLCSKPD